MDDDVFRGYGVEISLPHDKTPEQYDSLTVEQRKELHKDAFLKIRETLTRIGVASRKEKNLYQSCHIFHKRGRYAIMMFKELFALDGKATDITDEDLGRRNAIVKLLEEWGLLKVKNPDKIKAPIVPMNHIKILKYSEKGEWTLVQKYNVGVVKK